MGNPSLKHPPTTNHGNIPLPLLDTDHPQRLGSDSTKNQGISNDLRNLDRVVGDDTTPAALPITELPQEEQIDSLDNQGISSSQKSSPKQIYIPPGVCNEDRAGDGYDTDGQIVLFLGDKDIEGTQIFEKEESKPPVLVPVQTNVESSTRMVLEVASVPGAAGPAPLAKQYIDWVKEELKLRFQPTRGNKKLLLEIFKDAMNSKLVRYLTLEEAKENRKPKIRKIGDGSGMKQVFIKQFPYTTYWKFLQPETATVYEPANP